MRAFRSNHYGQPFAPLIGGLTLAFIGVVLVDQLVKVSPFSMPVTLGILVAGCIALDYYHDRGDNA